MAGPLGISSSRSAALLASVDDFSLDFLDDDGSSSEVALTDGSFSGDGFGGESGFGRSESTDYFFSGGFDDGDSDDVGTDAGTKGCAERLLLKSMPAYLLVRRRQWLAMGCPFGNGPKNIAIEKSSAAAARGWCPEMFTDRLLEDANGAPVL